jgi:hypothetical protein
MARRNGHEPLSLRRVLALLQSQPRHAHGVPSGGERHASRAAERKLCGLAVGTPVAQRPGTRAAWLNDEVEAGACCVGNFRAYGLACGVAPGFNCLRYPRSEHFSRHDVVLSRGNSGNETGLNRRVLPCRYVSTTLGDKG